MAPAQEKADSVYDFLYFDLPRIQIFNSQFSQYGHLTELTRSTETSSTSGGGFDLKVARADASEGEQTGISKKYQAQFVAPLTFLDHAKGMIVRDITRAGIGHFVLATGSLRILDLMMLKNAWDLASVKTLATRGAQSVSQNNPANQSRQERRAKQRRNDVNDPASTMNFVFEMLRIMPHSLQGQMESGLNQIWSSMRAEGFITQPNDLLLNHGIELSGQWNLVGILDATPAPEKPIPAPKVVDPNTHSLVGNLALTIQPLARQMLGRPAGSYGVTPLLIFREVGS